jgi:rfaE bifunctional protein kinase chain/domain
MKKQNNIDNNVNVLCYGHFNVIHPGHIRYLSFANSLGTRLTVLLKSDFSLHQDEGGSAFFSYQERYDLLNSVPIKKEIMSTGLRTLAENISLLKPNKLVLGHEFQSTNLSETSEIKSLCESNGVELIFHSGSSNINRLFDSDMPMKKVLSENKERFQLVCQRHEISASNLKRSIKKFTDLSVIVIGDTIVDEFVFCQPLGVSSEAPVLVVKEQGSSRFVGGAGIVAKHIKSLGASCHFISVLGCDEIASFVEVDIANHGIENSLIRVPNRPTTLKKRYVADTQKVFRVSVIDDNDVSEMIENQMIEVFEEKIIGHDCVIISDFVYGVITPRVLNEIMRLTSKHNVKLFGDLQCSSQIGDVLKFRHFDMIFPTEKEARIALSNKDDSVEFVARKILEISQCKNLVIKLGKDGLLAYQRESETSIVSEHFPAISVNPVDVAGAGDSLLATMALAVSAGASTMEASVLGNMVASIAVERMGNVPVSRDELLTNLDEFNL